MDRKENRPECEESKMVAVFMDLPHDHREEMKKWSKLNHIRCISGNEISHRLRIEDRKWQEYSVNLRSDWKSKIFLSGYVE